MKFDTSILSHDDFKLADSILGGREGQGIHREPDLVIGEDGKPYLFRWWVVRQWEANTYFHVQVADDPQRPEHDHPWDNTSVILSGGYDELWKPEPWLPHSAYQRRLRKGDVVHRSAAEAHRLILPAEFPYTMTLFSTGPAIRKWGFWFPGGWRSHDDVLAMENGMSTFTEEAKANE